MDEARVGVFCVCLSWPPRHRRCRPAVLPLRLGRRMTTLFLPWLRPFIPPPLVPLLLRTGPGVVLVSTYCQRVCAGLP